MTEPVAEGTNVGDDFDELRKRAMAHPGRLAYERWEQWGRVVTILSVNHAELVGHLDEPNRSEDAAIELIRDVGPRRTDGPDYFTEVYRLLHNYLASVMTLVDHSRNLVLGYPESSEVRREYQGRVDQIKGNPVAKFVQDLRHVVLHAELPALISAVSWTEDHGPRHELLLDREALLGRSSWTAPSREYIKGQPPEFTVRKPIDEYQDQVMTLSAWLSRQFRGLHGAEVDDYHPAA